MATFFARQPLVMLSIASVQSARLPAPRSEHWCIVSVLEDFEAADLKRPQSELHAFRSVILIIPTTFPSLYACSFVSLLQVQAKFFLAVKVFPSCSIRSSPSAIWQTMAFIIGGPAVFDPGWVKLGNRDASAYPSKAEQRTPPANFAEVPKGDIGTLYSITS